MAKSGGSRDGLSEAFQELLANVARVLLGLGSLLTLIGAGFLVFTCVRVAGDAKVTGEALKNVGILRQVLLFGSIGVGVGASFLFWGEALNTALMLAFAAILFFSPAWVPMIAATGDNQAATAAIGSLQLGGSVLGAVAAAVLVIEVAAKTRQRIKVGVKADGLKYGKGVKEEKDKQNVFLGRCWQLPYCRKFVRERCPIFHNRRTCWRERVGCMCEEEVIRVAMENKPITKDAVLNTPIPRNHRLTPKQKAARCHNCVIYNEHQRHKYKAVVPIVLLAFLGIYAGLHTSLTGAVGKLLTAADRAVGVMTFNNGRRAEVPQLIVEGLLFFIMLLLLTYSMKLVEYLVFKLKV